MPLAAHVTPLGLRRNCPPRKTSHLDLNSEDFSEILNNLLWCLTRESAFYFQFEHCQFQFPIFRALDACWATEKKILNIRYILCKQLQLLFGSPLSLGLSPLPPLVPLCAQWAQILCLTALLHKQQILSWKSWIGNNGLIHNKFRRISKLRFPLTYYKSFIYWIHGLGYSGTERNFLGLNKFEFLPQFLLQRDFFFCCMFREEVGKCFCKVLSFFFSSEHTNGNIY